MASHMVPVTFLLSLSLLLPSSLATVICEDLPVDLCAFAVSSTGQRCLLESYRTTKDGSERRKYQCKASEVVAERLSDWIESDECVRACGADRSSTIGISSDALLDSQFTGKLCSSTCYESCSNIVDLYFNLAAAEGVFLPDLCAARRSGTRRSMLELLSSGAASGPAAAAVKFAASPLA